MPASTHDATTRRYDWEDDVVAYVQDELSPPARAAFEAVMERSALCRLQAYETRRTLASLQSVAPVTATHGLRDAVHDAMTREAPAPPRRRLMSVALPLAAVLALLLGGVLIALSLTRNPGTSATTAHGAATAPSDSDRHGLAWLASVQSPSGAWEDARDASHRPHIALTGLTLLAFTHDDALSERYAATIRAAANYLQQTQSANGRLGGTEGTRFDHAIATCALLEVYTRTPRPDLAATIRRALHGMPPWTGHGSAFDYAPETRPNAAQFWARLAHHRAIRARLITRTSEPQTTTQPALRDALVQLVPGPATTRHGMADAPRIEHNTLGGRVFSTSMAVLLHADFATTPEDTSA